jgi:hypothetical protein
MLTLLASAKAIEPPSTATVRTADGAEMRRALTRGEPVWGRADAAIDAQPHDRRRRALHVLDLAHPSLDEAAVVHDHMWKPHECRDAERRRRAVFHRHPHQRRHEGERVGEPVQEERAP